MIITIFVLLYLALRLYRGYHIGFVGLILNLIFGAVVFILAIMLQNPVGNWLYQQFGSSIMTELPAETSLMLYRFVAFFVLVFILQQIMRLIRHSLPLAHRRGTAVGTSLNRVTGALIALIAGYFIVYVGLSMLNAFDIVWVHQQIASAPFLKFIIYDTPGLSNGVFNNLFNISRTAA